MTSIRWPNERVIENWHDINEKARRERIAIAAMQGLLAVEAQDGTPFLYEELARDAVNMADALIKVLDEPKEQG